MNKNAPGFFEVTAWPEFRAAWIITGLSAVIFICAAFFTSAPWFLTVLGVLLLGIIGGAFWTIFDAASSRRNTKIQRSELGGILKSMDDAIIVYDDSFRVLFFNPAAERIFGVASPAIVGHVISPRDVETPGWQTLVQSVFPSLAPRVIARSKEGDYPQVVDLSFVEPPLEFRVTTAPLNDEQGARLAFMKIIEDRTPLLEAVRSKSEFITVASHQLRGPVTDIKWALESLGKASELNEADRMIVDNATAASEGLLRRIEDLLSIAKMEEGEVGYNFEETDIVEFIGRVLADVLPAAQKAGIKVYFDRPVNSLPHVFIDPKQLPLTLINLLENAIRYNVQNGEVIVRADKVQDKPFVAVSVKDTGIGVPPEDIPRLFAKFYRADNAVRFQTEGSGLGLYIAKGVVKAHGGDIWVESELNRGTTITFTVPTDPAALSKKEFNGGFTI